MAGLLIDWLTDYLIDKLIDWLTMIRWSVRCCVRFYASPLLPLRHKGKSRLVTQGAIKKCLCLAHWPTHLSASCSKKFGKGGKNILWPISYTVSGSKSPGKRYLEAATTWIMSTWRRYGHRSNTINLFTVITVDEKKKGFVQNLYQRLN